MLVCTVSSGSAVKIFRVNTVLASIIAFTIIRLTSTESLSAGLLERMHNKVPTFYKHIYERCYLLQRRFKIRLK